MRCALWEGEILSKARIVAIFCCILLIPTSVTRGPVANLAPQPVERAQFLAAPASVQSTTIHDMDNSSYNQSPRH